MPEIDGFAPDIELSRAELIAQHTAPLLLSIVEKVPVRFIPTNFARHQVLSRVSRFAFLYSVTRQSGLLENELRDRGERFPDAVSLLSIAALGARDSYWLGSGANAMLKDSGVPRVERPAHIASSTGLLLHSHGPEAHIRQRRSVSMTDNWGRRRLRDEKMEVNSDGRVQYRDEPRSFLRELQATYPAAGCPAHNVRTQDEVSPVVAYWRAYVRKVFTPWGRKRSAPAS